MAQIDGAITDSAIIPASGIFIIRPETIGEEWTIHNIYVPFGGKAQLYRSDDVSGVDLGIFIEPIPVSKTGQFNYHCTNDEFLIIRNNGTDAIKVGFDGVVSGVS